LVWLRPTAALGYNQALSERIKQINWSSPFDDVRVRKALLLATDQWHGAPRRSGCSGSRGMKT
jgi:hypothetical protein